MTTTKTPTATCRRCRATLHSARSVARGIGPTCERNERREAAAAVFTRHFKDAARATSKALALLAERALIPTAREGRYIAVSSTGEAGYLVDTINRSCTCKGHIHAGHCYHLVAAQITETTTTRRAAYALAA